MKKFILAITSLSLLVFAFSSCENTDDLPRVPNENLTDSTGKIILADMFISGELDEVSFTYWHGRNDYASIAYHQINGYCNAFDTLQGYTLTERMHMSNKFETRNSFYVDVSRCIPIDSILEQVYIDSLYKTQNYPFITEQDSGYGVQITYIDDEGKTWSSRLGNNTGTLSRFLLNLSIPNERDFGTKYITFGEFSCFLYNREGEFKELRKGSFKLRMGSYKMQ